MTMSQLCASAEKANSILGSMRSMATRLGRDSCPLLRAAETHPGSVSRSGLPGQEGVGGAAASPVKGCRDY